MFPEPNI